MCYNFELAMKELFLLFLLEILLVWCIVILISILTGCESPSEKTKKDLQEIYQFEKEHKIQIL